MATKKAPAKKTTKKVTSKKTAASTSKKKTTAKKAATKKPVAKKATKKSAPTKKTAVKNKTVKNKKTATKKTATKKTGATKSPTKKTTVKNTKKAVAKKAAAPKKSTPKSTAGTKSASTTSKPSTKKTTKSASKAKASKKVTAAVEEVLEKPAAEAPAKPATKKATTKKTTKKATRKKAVKPREKVVVVGKVGQAPRRTANEVAASNPFPVPPQIHETVEEASTTPSPEAKAAKKEFKVKDQIVYPAHGVGVIEAIESQDIVGTKIEVFVIQFDHEKLRLRVPTEKAKTVGMRELSTVEFVDKTIDVLQGRARIKRTMWSRRAQEYEAKINSGDLNAVAEVVRDLYRSPEQPEQSYSERQLFEAALDRMAREVAAVKKIDLGAAVGELDASLQKKQIVI